jgi:DNA-binding NtrC family response regulator
LKRSIFYIDDDAGCLRVFAERYSTDNDVRTAETLEEGRRLLRECAADIVISDQSMPEIKGTDFLSEVAEKYPRSFRVLLTGSIGFGEVIHDIGEGTVHFFLPKPWTEDHIRNLFERAGIHLAQYSERAIRDIED